MIYLNETNYDCNCNCGVKSIIKEYNYTDKVEIPDCFSGINCILDICVNLCDVKYEIIHSCTGLRVCITGIKNIKIVYESCGCTGHVQTFETCLPFFESIPIDNSKCILDIDSQICWCKENVVDKRCIYILNIAAIKLLYKFGPYHYYGDCE